MPSLLWSASTRLGQGRIAYDDYSQKMDISQKLCAAMDISRRRLWALNNLYDTTGHELLVALPLIHFLQNAQPGQLTQCPIRGRQRLYQ
jgi:hypothetical protein